MKRTIVSYLAIAVLAFGVLIFASCEQASAAAVTADGPPQAEKTVFYDTASEVPAAQAENLAGVKATDTPREKAAAAGATARSHRTVSLSPANAFDTGPPPDAFTGATGARAANGFSGLGQANFARAKI